MTASSRVGLVGGEHGGGRLRVVPHRAGDDRDGSLPSVFPARPVGHAEVIGPTVLQRGTMLAKSVPANQNRPRRRRGDKVAGLESGADDYLTKPLDGAPARAREAWLARAAVLEAGPLRLDPATREVRRGDVEIELSAREFALLETFMRHRYEQRANVVEVYVRYLREKIDRPFRVRSIETVRGAGYRLRRDGEGETPPPRPADGRLRGGPRGPGRDRAGRRRKPCASGSRTAPKPPQRRLNLPA